MKKNKKLKSKNKKEEYLSPIIRELQLNIPEKIDEETLNEIVSVITTGVATS